MKKLFLSTLLAVVATTLLALPPYVRKDYQKRWLDADKDCQNTRQEVLIAESVIPVTLDKRGCKVLSGQWNDPYSGKTFSDPRLLDIDHMVPLKEIHISGGFEWTQEQRKKYANDLDNEEVLIAVSRSQNRSKGSKDPAYWMPKNKNYWCVYTTNWVAIKTKYNLSMDIAEIEAINTLYFQCFGWKNKTRK